MCPDLKAAVALGILFLLFPGNEWNPQPAPAAVGLFWKWFSSWLGLVGRVSSETKHRFLSDTFPCVEVALEDLLQDFFLVSSLFLLQGAHSLCLYPTWSEHNTPVEHQGKLEAILNFTLQHSSWGITQKILPLGLRPLKLLLAAHLPPSSLSVMAHFSWLLYWFTKPLCCLLPFIIKQLEKSFEVNKFWGGLHKREYKVESPAIRSQ